MTYYSTLVKAMEVVVNIPKLSVFDIAQALQVCARVNPQMINSLYQKVDGILSEALSSAETTPGVITICTNLRTTCREEIAAAQAAPVVADRVELHV